MTTQSTEDLISELKLFNYILLSRGIDVTTLDKAQNRLSQLSTPVGGDDNYEGAMYDLDSALDVLIASINGEKDLASAAEWVRLNYPEKAEKLNTSGEHVKKSAESIHDTIDGDVR